MRVYNGKKMFHEDEYGDQHVNDRMCDCSAGVFITTCDQMENMFSIFFRDRPPSFTFYGWGGNLETIKGVTFRDWYHMIALRSVIIF